MYTIHQPKLKILQQYISEFTVLKQERFKPIHYFAFPHYVNSIFFFNNTKIEFKDSQLIIDKTNEQATTVGILGKYTTPLYLSYKNKVEEIAINFTPTGLNYFFKENSNEIASQSFQVLNHKIWVDFTEKLYKTDENKRIELLETFLYSQLQKKDLCVINQVISLIHQDVSATIKELASKVNLSERTLNRLFNTYTACSPSTYKKIVRFRNAVRMNNTQMNLTELCLANEYYDSPHFAREFQKLTGQNPRKFFSSFEFMSENKFPYIFE